MAKMINRELEVDKYSTGVMLGIKPVGSDNWINFNKGLSEDRKQEAKEFVGKLKSGDMIELTINEDTGMWHKGKRIRKSKIPEPSPEDIIPEKQYADKSNGVTKPVVINEFTNKDSSFYKLNQVEGHVVKKGTGNFAANYISWSDAWNELKKIYPKSTFKVYEREGGMPYFKDDDGAFVKVGVTVEGIEHISFLPVMDNKFNAMKSVKYTITKFGKEEEVQPYTMFDINRSIQRAFAKAIAMQGMGLYVFRGEDIPKKEE